MRALEFVVRTLFQLAIIVFLLRFILQWVRADFRNPLCQAVIRISNPVVVPLRRVIPGWGGADLATLVAAFLIQILALVVVHVGINGYPFPPVIALLISAIRQLLVTTLQMYFFLILFFALFSWFAPSTYHPVMYVLHTVSEPVLRPVRRVIPPIGGLDLSALALLIAIQAVILLIQAY